MSAQNQFLKFLAISISRTEILVGISTSGRILEIEKKLNTELAFFEMLTAYADQHELELVEYIEQIIQIQRNFGKVNEEISRRKSPLWERFLDVLYSFAEPIDGFLYKVKLPPVVTPLVSIIRKIAKEISDLAVRAGKRIAPPPISKVLPPPLPTRNLLPSEPLSFQPLPGPSDEEISDRVQRTGKRIAPPPRRPYFNSFVDCVKDCYPEAARQSNADEYKQIFGTNPQLASSAFLSELRKTNLSAFSKTNLSGFRLGPGLSAKSIEKNNNQ